MRAIIARRSHSPPTLRQSANKGYNAPNGTCNHRRPWSCVVSPGIERLRVEGPIIARDCTHRCHIAGLIDQDDISSGMSPNYFVTTGRSAKANFFRIYLDQQEPERCVPEPSLS